MSAGRRPARSIPERSASPILPVPRTAMRCVIGSALGGEGAQEEHDVGGPLREAPYEVAVPVLAVGHVDADLLAGGRQPALLVGPDAVEHLVLVRPLGPA